MSSTPPIAVPESSLYETGSTADVGVARTNQARPSRLSQPNSPRPSTRQLSRRGEGNVLTDFIEWLVEKFGSAKEWMQEVWNKVDIWWQPQYERG
ncbi:hypothetical protein FRB99_001255 [Tulasnella sp. 403]|nr:hypothetical protein FRB99_001255 [Tulasnella sp. 403]